MAYCRGRAPVVAVSDTYRLAPWADVLYSCQWQWWDAHQGVPGFAGLKYALEWQAGRWPGVQVLENTGTSGLEREPTGIRTGYLSGYQAINVAVHLGAKRIVLLGYDMQADGKRGHFFGEHPPGLRRTHDFTVMLPFFAELIAPLTALGIEVINCTRRSALKCFPRQPLAAVL